jgi:predicted O-methyltransferase YrrM
LFNHFYRNSNREAMTHATTDLADAEIAQLLADPTAFPASVGPAAACYLHDLVLGIKPQLVVEVGCCRGFSTLHLAKALRQNGAGQLVSFDLDTGDANLRIQRAGLAPLVSFVQGNSAVEGRSFFRAGGGIDLAFIDGDHTRRGCLRDAEVFLPLLKIGGVLVLHDVVADNCGWLGPRHLVDLLGKARGEGGSPCFAVEELPGLDRFGIAVCRKLAELPPGSLQGGLAGWYRLSRLAQFIEIARFERKTSPLQMLVWGLSKWRRIASHW